MPFVWSCRLVSALWSFFSLGFPFRHSFIVSWQQFLPFRPVYSPFCVDFFALFFVCSAALVESLWSCSPWVLSAGLWLEWFQPSFLSADPPCASWSICFALFLVFSLSFTSFTWARIWFSDYSGWVFPFSCLQATCAFIIAWFLVCRLLKSDRESCFMSRRPGFSLQALPPFISKCFSPFPCTRLISVIFVPIPLSAGFILASVQSAESSSHCFPYYFIISAWFLASRLNFLIPVTIPLSAGVQSWVTCPKFKLQALFCLFLQLQALFCKICAQMFNLGVFAHFLICSLCFAQFHLACFLIYRLVICPFSCLKNI